MLYAKVESHSSYASTPRNACPRALWQLQSEGSLLNDSWALGDLILACLIDDLLSRKSDLAL